MHLAKMNNLSKHHCVGLPEARVPMQLHRLHRLKAGPVKLFLFEGSSIVLVLWIKRSFEYRGVKRNF